WLTRLGRRRNQTRSHSMSSSRKKESRNAADRAERRGRATVVAPYVRKADNPTQSSHSRDRQTCEPQFPCVSWANVRHHRLRGNDLRHEISTLSWSPCEWRC